jgi:NADP-dependent 3-hydroxy acid dehydrogenase YdfG
MSNGLTDRRIIVTGGTSGIGAAVVRQCAAEGAKVVAFGRDAQRLKAIAASTGATDVAMDLADRESVNAAFDQAATVLGGLDCLINCAALMIHSKISNRQWEDWRDMIDVNVMGVLYASAAAIPSLLESELADLVIVGSPASAGPRLADFTVYSASKSAIVQITAGLRLDLKESNVRICLVNPGLTNSEGFGPGIRDESLRETITAIKESRGMPPEVVAAEICRVISLPRDRFIPEIGVEPFPLW